MYYCHPVTDHISSSDSLTIPVPMATTCGMMITVIGYYGYRPYPYIDDNILEEANQVLSQFKHDGSCDHTSELSPVSLVWLVWVWCGWG